MKRFFFCRSSKEEWNKHDERLLQAVEGQDAERVATAIQKKGASPSKLDGEGRSAFHVAAAKGHEGCLSVILEHSVDTSITDASGRTALHMAAKNGHSRCVQQLLQYNCPVGIVDQAGRTALHYAAIQGDLTTVQMLSNHKSPVNGKDNEGSSPLALAARMCHPDICNYLMDRGADINIRDNHKNVVLLNVVLLNVGLLNVVLLNVVLLNVVLLNVVLLNVVLLNVVLLNVVLLNVVLLNVVLLNVVLLNIVLLHFVLPNVVVLNVVLLNVVLLNLILLNIVLLNVVFLLNIVLLNVVFLLNVVLLTVVLLNVVLLNVVLLNYLYLFFNCFIFQPTAKDINDANKKRKAPLPPPITISPIQSMGSSISSTASENLSFNTLVSGQPSGAFYTPMSRDRNMVQGLHEEHNALQSEVAQLRKENRALTEKTHGLEVSLASHAVDMREKQVAEKQMKSELENEVVLLRSKLQDKEEAMWVIVEEIKKLKKAVDMSALEVRDVQRQWEEDDDTGAGPGSEKLEVAGLEEKARSLISALHAEATMLCLRNKDLNTRLQRTEAELTRLSQESVALAQHLAVASELEHSKLELAALRAQLTGPANKTVPLATYENLKQQSEQQIRQLEEDFERVQQRARDYDGKMRRLQQQLRLLPLGRDASQTELSSPETTCNQLLQLKSAARADGSGIGDTESISYPSNLSIEEGTKEELQQTYEQQLREARAELSAEWAARQEAEWRAEEVKQMYERRIEDIEHKVATSRTLQQGVEGQMEKVKLSYERQARELDSQLNSARAAQERERKHVTELQMKLEEAQQALAHSVPLRQYEELETSFNLSLEETSERLAGLTEQYNVAQDEIAQLQAQNFNQSISRVPQADRIDIEEQLRNALDTREVEALELTTRYAEVKDRRRELSAALESLQLELKSVSDRLTESEKLRVVLKVDLDTVRRELADVSHRHSNVEKENTFLKSALKESKQELKNVLTLYEDLQKDVSFKNEHIKSLEMMVADVTDKLSLVQEEMRLMQTKAQNLEYSQMQMVPKELVEKECVMLQEEAAMLKNMMSEMSQSCLKVETEKQELEGLLLKAKEKLSDLENENRVAQGEVNRASLTMSAIQAECNENVPRHRHDEIVSLLKEEEEVLRLKLDKIQNKYKEATEDRAEFKTKVDELLSTVTDLKQINETSQAELENNNQEIVILGKMNEELTLRMKEAIQSAEEYKKLIENIDSSLQQKNFEVLDAVGMYNASQKEVQILKQEIASLEQARQDIDAQLSEAVVNYKTSEQARSILQESLDKMNAKMLDMTENLSANQSEIESLRKELVDVVPVVRQADIIYCTRTALEDHTEMNKPSEIPISELQVKAEELSNIKELSEKTLSTFKEDQERTEEEKLHLEEMNRELKNELTKVTEENVVLQKGMGELQKCFEEKTKEMEINVIELHQEIDLMQEKLATEYVTKEKYSELEIKEKQLLELMHTYNEAIEEIDKLSDEVAHQKQEHTALLERHAWTKKTLEEVTWKLEKDSSEVEKDIVEKEQEIVFLRSEVERLKAEADQTQKELGSLRAYEEEKSANEAEIAVLSKRVEDLLSKHEDEVQGDMDKEAELQWQLENVKHEMIEKVGKLKKEIDEAQQKQEAAVLEACRCQEEEDRARSEKDASEERARDLERELSEREQAVQDFKRAAEELQNKLDNSGILMEEKDKKVSAVQEERARLRLALNSLSQLPYATGSTKRQNQQLEGLHIQLRKVQQQLLEAEKRHLDVVSVYRTHLLCAVQGQMDEDIRSTLMHIVKMHKTKEPLS
uniref:uveal autoantigen with coiled-coil domains and ankyrin repeats protein-like n=1 Tax=Myxine glutinosa TaxID=7769 RepID=UPI00358EE1E5